MMVVCRPAALAALSKRSKTVCTTPCQLRARDGRWVSSPVECVSIWDLGCVQSGIGVKLWLPVR
jgi:hypothetical protein